MKKKKLGEVLRDRGMISSPDLVSAIVAQQGKAIHLGEIMLERGFVCKEDLGAALEEVSQIPYLDCSTIIPDESALKLVTHPIAERLCVLPVRIEHRRLVVAMAAPQNLATLDELRFKTGMEISPRLSFRSELQLAIRTQYGQGEERLSSGEGGVSRKMKFEEVEFFSTSSRQANQEAIQEVHADLRQEKTPAVRMVSEALQMAMAKRASDIHIEPRTADTVIRMRVDGVLHDYQLVPRALQNSLISRIKILSDMDISERRNPQDGRFMVSVAGRQVDLRVSTLPTQYGEKVVIRLLDTSAPLTTYSELGMPDDVCEGLNELLAAPQGMVLVTGPTGSGKSTTLYSSLNKLRKDSINIVTVEDPVEYVLPGINQVHVNTKAGLTFVSCLRSILRQDPNIIMVGEIRDKETAEIVMKASQTGHVVLSTLHTNDSVSAVLRLLDLGVPGYLISASVSGILAQRLVRKLCSCHTYQSATPAFKARMLQLGSAEAPAKMAVAQGCEKCNHTGYAGRLGIYELLRIDDSIRPIIRANGSVEQIRGTARMNGMRLMQEDALERVRTGVTTLEEVLRIVPMENATHSECQQCKSYILPTFNYCPTCGAKCIATPAANRSRSRELVSEGIL